MLPLMMMPHLRHLVMRHGSWFNLCERCCSRDRSEQAALADWFQHLGTRSFVSGVLRINSMAYIAYDEISCYCFDRSCMYGFCSRDSSENRILKTHCRAHSVVVMIICWGRGYCSREMIWRLDSITLTTSPCILQNTFFLVKKSKKVKRETQTNK